MGQYTRHWEQYRHRTKQRTLRLLGVLLVLPVIALVGYGLSQLTAWATYVQGALIVAWIAVFVRLAIGGAQVECPRCNNTYARGKFIVDCPKCGLRMFQEDP